MKRLVIFDLDGTLLNTIADLAQSTNYALRKIGFPEHEVDEYRFFVGNGINKLFERALPEGEKSEENISKVRKHFLVHYSEHKMDKSRPYPGIPELLSALHEKGVIMAVASNKYQSATELLVEHYFSGVPFAAVFGQREGIKTKPDPQIVEDILTVTKVDKEDVLYVGDSGIDMLTAKNAGIQRRTVPLGHQGHEVGCAAVPEQGWHPDCGGKEALWRRECRRGRRTGGVCAEALGQESRGLLR